MVPTWKMTGLKLVSHVYSLLGALVLKPIPALTGDLVNCLLLNRHRQFALLSFDGFT